MNTADRKIIASSLSVSVRQFSTYNRHFRRKLKAYKSDSVCTVYRSPIIHEPKVVSPCFISGWCMW